VRPVTIDDPGFLDDVYWLPAMEPRQDVNWSLLLQTLMQKGLEAEWYAATRCPCGSIGLGGGSARPDCPVCGGDGWDFHSQQRVRVAVVGVRKDVSIFEKFNPMETGGAYFVVRPEHGPALYDRIVLTNSRITISDLLPRRATLDDPVEKLRWPVVPQEYRLAPIAPTEEEPDPPTTGEIGVVYIRTQNEDGTAGAKLVEGEDFEVTDDGDIDWTLGDEQDPPTAPRPGCLFGIYYKTRPVFRVTSDSHVLRDAVTQDHRSSVLHEYLPVGFSAKLEWQNWQNGV
jgi:hypothetical protein